LRGHLCDSTVQCAVIGYKLKQNANEGCGSCASLAGLVLSFITCFILLVIAPLRESENALWAYLIQNMCWKESGADPGSIYAANVFHNFMIPPNVQSIPELARIKLSNVL